MQLKQQCDLSTYSTFGIGGPARYLTLVKTTDELLEAITFAQAHNLDILPLGKGSNTLFDDRGFDGLVIINKIDHIFFETDSVRAGSGASFSLLGSKASRKGLSGLEFAAGIPGSVGGAVFMNAGANGRDVKDALESVTYMTYSGELITQPASALQLSYRHSCFHSIQAIIVEASFRLTENAAAKMTQKQIVDYRLQTQPYKAKSAGCAFRNPNGNAAGRLIEEAGLKGARFGGAEVSSMHANFIVNSAGATARDVEQLIAHIRSVVLEKTGVHLEDEIRRIPYRFTTRD